MAKVKVVGYESFNSKKGNRCVMIHTIKDIVKRDSHTVVSGQQATSFYVPEHLQSKVSQALVGKEVEAYTAFFGGRENLLDILS